MPFIKHKVSDYEINGKVRRELVSRNMDLKRVRYHTSRGAVEITGTLKFTEPKSIGEMAKELFLIEQAIMGIKGVRKVKIEFDDWEKTRSGKFARHIEEEEEGLEKKTFEDPNE